MITYRNGRFFKDNEPFFFLGVEYQYYRDRRSNWPKRLDQIRAAHANTITFYCPWRHHLLHDPKTGAVSYDFDGRTLDSRDLRHFMELCEERGLYMVAKVGPFVHSELNIGGLPDMASPSFNAGIEPCRMHDGSPLHWDYDHSILPSPFDPAFDAAAKEWLMAVRDCLSPHAYPAGNIIAVQINDETIYCTSNEPPWTLGFEAPAVREFHRMLEEKYGDIESYNKAHGTTYRAFCFVPPPTLEAPPKEPLALADFGEFQWRIRRDLYCRYASWLGLDLPLLTNFAAITPPIIENVPDNAPKAIPPQLAAAYADWWFAQNRVDQDRHLYHYGMISWLGVAAYNIADTHSEPLPEVGRNEVFLRYLATARRRRGINMEENWGFSQLYHPLSRHPLVPVFQTLVSIAGGCTGYVVFTGVNHAYFGDDLDRVTRRKHPTYPDAAPIGPEGETGPMYEAMALIGQYFAREGKALLSAEPVRECRLLVYPPWAAVASWAPRDPSWPKGGDLADLLLGLTATGVGYDIAEIPAFSVEELLEVPVAVIRFGFFMAEAEQRKLAEFVSRGGKLLAIGEPPVMDDLMRPCTVLSDFLATAQKGVLWHHGGFETEALLASLAQVGVSPSVRFPAGTYAVLHQGQRDTFVFFFEFGSTHHRVIYVNGRPIELWTGPKTCAVLHLREDRLVSYCVKGVNEHEGVVPEVRIRYGSDEVVVNGDGCAFSEPT